VDTALVLVAAKHTATRSASVVQPARLVRVLAVAVTTAVMRQVVVHSNIEPEQMVIQQVVVARAGLPMM
jgi:hypothetical protein